jgi:hypothetical protein
VFLFKENGLKTACKICGAKTLVTGWQWCETCASSADHRQQLGISVIADAIVDLEQRGVSHFDQTTFFLAHGIDKKRLDAAHAHVADRYRAIEMKRPRASKGW